MRAGPLTDVIANRPIVSAISSCEDPLALVMKRTRILQALAAGIAAFGLAGASAPAAAGPAAPTPVAEKKGAPPAKAAPAKAPSTGISWKVDPSTVIVFLDGKKLGEAGKLKFSDTRPGRHAVKLVKGQDETETEVVVKKGEVVEFKFEFTD